MDNPRPDDSLQDTGFAPIDDALKLPEDSVETMPSETASNVQEEKIADTESVLKAVRPVYGGRASAGASTSTSMASPDLGKVSSSRRFLAAYITSILSALSLLSSGAVLGYALIDHFLAPKDAGGWASYFDFSPFYLGLITSMIVFGVLYLITSQYVARQVTHDTVGVRDWRAYRVVYSAFTAILLTIAASVLGSLLYIPLSLALIVQDYESHYIWTQVLGGLHVLVWIGVLIWQERLVKHGKKVALQGVVVSALVVLVVLLSSIFLVISKTDERFDNRVVDDLTAIESAVDRYKSSNRGELPEDLDKLSFTSDPLVKKRLGNYKYTVREQSQESTEEQDELFQREMWLEDEVPSPVSGLNGTRSDSYWSLQQDEVEMVQEYTLCATFRTESTEKDESPISELLLGSASAEDSFRIHKKGEVCFDRS